MQATERLLKNVEGKWLKPLFEHCKANFSKVHLPSHDEVHHLRVWCQARAFVLALARKGITLNEVQLEELIIAVFFHDMGMSETLQKDHGKISRRMAKDYLKDKQLHGLELDRILEAIELHDKKDYYEVHQPNQFVFNLQGFLNVCDDLDALGGIGAYRYSEIYLLRNIPVENLSDTVLENLNNRYNHMKGYFGFSKGFAKLHNQRYIAARNFFKDLSFQIKNIGNDLSSLSGPLGVINLLNSLVIKDKKKLADAAKSAIILSSDFYVTHFFERLEKEMLPDIEVK